MQEYSEAERKAYDRGFEIGDTVGKMAAIFGPGAAAVYATTFHSHLIDTEIAAMACVFAQLPLLIWLPDKIANWLGHRYASKK
tara:strand:+ start:23237 stop:23485 length:249 start_codon:yes stop_codon:yes gene_type:complete